MTKPAQDMEQYSDNRLMPLVANGDPSAFRILYERFELRIYNLILRYTGSREIAQDLMQDTFTRVWVAAHTLDSKKGRFANWLFKIALNTTKNEMSKKQYGYHFVDIDDRSNLQTELIQSEDDQPDNLFHEGEMRNAVFRAIGTLKPYHREIVVLRMYHQLTFREIAAITDTPEGTLKARFHKAIPLLKEQLAVLED